MAILVTGGAGFVGSHLIERLLQSTDQAIHCLDNFSDYYDPAIKRRNVEGFCGSPRVTMHEGSFCDEQFVSDVFSAGFEYVVHLGGLAGVHPSVVSPLEYEFTNVRGTLVLLEAVRRAPVKRFVFASSSTVYGSRTPVPFEEDGRVGAPQSPYGATKLAAETMCLTYLDLHGVPAVCLRPFSVYGTRVRPDLAISIFAKSILRGKTVRIFGDGSVRRDFTHVSDICSGIESSLFAEGVVGECINLGNENPIAIRDLLRMIEERLGRGAKIEWCTPNLADLAVTCASTAKASRLLNYSPSVRIEDGLGECVAWIAATTS